MVKRGSTQGALFLSLRAYVGLYFLPARGASSGVDRARNLRDKPRQSIYERPL